MDIFGKGKKKGNHGNKARKVPDFTRKQLNVEINPMLITKSHKLAADYGVTLYAITEHMVQIGIFYLDKIRQNREKKELLHIHLVDKHQLTSSYKDEEELIRLGEGRYSSELLMLARNVRRFSREMDRVFYQGKRTGTFTGFEEAKKKVLQSYSDLSYFLSKYPLDEMRDLDSDEQKIQ